VEDVHEVQCSRQVWWFGPQNSVVAVLEGTGGGTRRDREGCVKAKQLRAKKVTVGYGNLGVGPFHLRWSG
jgi:hypothetical protein